MQPEDIPRVVLPVVAIYGHGPAAEALANELALDGFDVRLTSDPVVLGGADVAIFAHTSQPGAGLAVVRALRRGALAGAGALVLWMSATTNLSETVRAFDAGADDVIRRPFATLSC